MAWQSNLFNNLIVLFVLLTLAFIIWSHVTKKSLPQLIQEIRDAMTTEDVLE